MFCLHETEFNRMKRVNNWIVIKSGGIFKQMRQILRFQPFLKTFKNPLERKYTVVHTCVLIVNSMNTPLMVQMESAKTTTSWTRNWAY